MLKNRAQCQKRGGGEGGREGFYTLRNLDWNLCGGWNHSLETSFMPLAYLWFLRVSVPGFWMSDLHRVANNNIDHLLRASHCQAWAECVANIRSLYPQNLEQCLAHRRPFKKMVIRSMSNSAHS